VRLRAIGAVLGALLPIATWAQAAWVEDPTVREQLAAGQVAIRVALDSEGAGGRVHAAVRIKANPEVIWGVLTDCEHAASFIPGLKRCTRIDSAPDGAWAVFEQEVKYSWLMPPVTAVFRAEYKRPQRIDFRRISGDLKDEKGTWVLAETAPGAAAAAAQTTIVEYELYVDPGFWVPRVLLRHSLRSELPAALSALRTRAEGLAAEH
jgi:carbon monoxide dehydrogenase subunit G